jgi:hypothetical protein
MLHFCARYIVTVSKGIAAIIVLNIKKLESFWKIYTHISKVWDRGGITT